MAIIHDRQSERLIARYIEQHPHRPSPAEGRLTIRGIAIWAIIGQFAAERGDIERVSEVYDIPREAVEAAIAYYERHKPLIDARIVASRGD